MDIGASVFPLIGGYGRPGARRNGTPPAVVSPTCSRRSHGIRRSRRHIRGIRRSHIRGIRRSHIHGSRRSRRHIRGSHGSRHSRHIRRYPAEMR
ncbi:hypothetical protein [Actinoplanes sp. NPDC049118]|uniref:hypothetical protein n=1 Tax=Actinoplanes sp. NPDC049118 TaxID=3155769 RepID=UPI0033EB4996